METRHLPSSWRARSHLFGVFVACPLALIAGIACNSLSGADSLSAVTCVRDCEGTSAYEPPRSDAAAPPPMATVTPPTADAGDASNGLTPSYCRGIVLYVPFDGDAHSRAGQTPAQSGNDVRFPNAKFGQAAKFDPDDAYFFASPFNGQALHQPNVGTVAVWMRPQHTNFGTRPIFRPQTTDTENNAGTDTTGPSLWLGNGGSVGMFVETTNVRAVVQANTSAAGVQGWSANEFHLVVGTWNSSPQAGSPSLTFMVKNSTAETFVLSTDAWTPRASTTNVVRIASELDTIDATVDDFAIWDRDLSADESRQLFASTVPISQACGL